jgi:hypothetical protein
MREGARRRAAASAKGESILQNPPAQLATAAAVQNQGLVNATFFNLLAQPFVAGSRQDHTTALNFR